VKIPDLLRDRFKALCALKRTNMQKEILEYIRKAVAKAARKG
jgi:hypothetical protein